MKRFLSLMLSIVVTSTVWATDTPLTLDVYNAHESSFHVNATIVSGATEAAIIDTGFTQADALRIAAKLKDSGKKLTTIFISQADPDFYFGASTLATIFPDVAIVTSAPVAKKIRKSIDQKIAFWGPKMGLNAPEQPKMPKVLAKSHFSIDGIRINVMGTTGKLSHRPYLWIEKTKTILGTIGVFGNLHVWTADTQTDEAIDAWIKQLDEMTALKPQKVIPGHMQADTQLSPSSIDFTKHYLLAFKREKAKAANSNELQQRMKTLYPDLGLLIALDIGSKVHTDEMSW